MSRFVGRRFALIEIDDMTGDDIDGHIIYAFEVQQSPVGQAVSRWLERRRSKAAS